MEAYRIEIPLSKLKESLILHYFDLKKKSLIKVALCKICSNPVVFSYDSHGNLAKHLKLHDETWTLYLNKLADAIDREVPSSLCFDPLKLASLIFDRDTGEEFSLRLPVSRIQRDFDNLKVTEVLTGVQRRLQTEYNSCPVGQFVGPYDQNEALHLSIQIPGADLDFEKYTQFVHPNSVCCKTFSIKDSYDNIEDLSKIESLNVEDDGVPEDDEYDSDEQMYYTCQNEQCKIPCPCSPCYGETQCPDHKVRHEEMFDVKQDLVAIRSKNEFCSDQSFFDQSYLIKYPGIPLHCKKCKRDFLHHICYHLDFHENCKFCRKGRYKTYAKTASEFMENIEKQDQFLKSVYPHCDNKFCEPYLRKRHIEFEHENAGNFTCDFCSTKFHARQSKEYHEAIHHSDSNNKEQCATCGKEFFARVTLENHVKYVHSEQRDHSCVICDCKFKQKKDMRTRMLNIHGFNMSKARYGDFEDQESFDCDICDKTFKYKKGLNAHMRMVHEGTSGIQKSFKCDLCISVYRELKNLNAHKRLKHSDSASEFPCTTCGKTFSQKKNLKRHENTHQPT